MAIKHATTKAPGEKLFAVADWNADHTGTITLTQHSDLSGDALTKHHWNQITGKPASYPPDAHASSHQSGGGDPLTALLRAIITDFFSAPFWANIPDKPSTYPPNAHAATHLVGASDALSVGVPVNISTANAEGSATNFARRDHVHAHPSGLGEDLHHARLHALSSASDHSGTITDSQHGARALGLHSITGGYIPFGSPAGVLTSSDKLQWDAANVRINCAGGAVFGTKVAANDFDCTGPYAIGGTAVITSGKVLQNLSGLANISGIITDSQHGTRGAGLHNLPIGCRAFENAAQTIADSTWTLINLQDEEWDDANMHDNSISNTRITIPAGQAGRYLIVASCAFVTNATGARWISIAINGTQRAEVRLTPQGTQIFVGECTTVYNLTAGQYVEMMVAQNSGGNLNTYPNALRTYLLVQKLGA